MELIYAKRVKGSTVVDTGYLRNYSADISICTDDSDNNDFELKMALTDRDHLLWIEHEVSTVIYAEGTEFGGVITGSVLDTANAEVTYTGKTWRGTLDDYIIEPPKGEDYLVKAAGLNVTEILKTLPHDPVIHFQPCTYTLPQQFQFDRYITTTEGITKMLTSVDDTLHLRLEYVVDDLQAVGYVKAYVEPRRDLSDDISLSQDYGSKINLKITRNGSTPRRLICLGKGDLKEREVINLYADDNWNITTQPISGATPVDVYDASSSDTLKDDGMKHFKELIDSHEQVEVSVSDLDIQVDDEISARDNVTGENVSAHITGIVWKHEDFGTYSTESWEYKTKERDYV